MSQDRELIHILIASQSATLIADMTSFVSASFRFIIFLVLATCSSAASQKPLKESSACSAYVEHTDRSPLNASFKKYALQILEHFHTPGLSVAVVDGDNTFTDAYGYAVLPDIEATAETLYYVGSITKSFTAASLLLALEDTSQSQNPLSLRSRVSTILPADFVLPDEYATAHATIEDVLTHRLGFPGGFPGHDMSYDGPNFTVRDAIRSLRHLPMTEELRGAFQYLNLGYMVIQHIIETLTGRWIGDSHHEKIWRPLSMNSTFIRLSDALKSVKESGSRFAYGYSWDDRSHEHYHQAWLDTQLVGGGGIISSVLDCSRYLHAMIDKTLPLSATAQRELVEPRMLMDEPTQFPHTSPPLYGAGWSVTSYRGHSVVMHAGAITGFSARLAFMPSDRWGVAMMSNTDVHGSHAIDALFLRLLDDVLNIPANERYDMIPEMDASDEQMLTSYENGRTILYPRIPNPPLPLALPLSEYEGTYYHPGYRDITFNIGQPPPRLPVAEHTEHVLHAELHRTVNVTLDLEHVSGEYFVAWTDTTVSVLFARNAVKAEFNLDAEGRVAKVGIHLIPAGDQVIWFEKVR